MSRPSAKPCAARDRREAVARRLADAARRDLHVADVDQTAQEGSGGQYRGPAGQPAAIVQRHGRDTAVGDVEAERLAFDEFEVRLHRKRRLHRRAIELPIGLSPGAANRWPFATVEHAKLDPARIGHPAHDTVERIDLADEMAFAEAADSGIAGQRADLVETLREQGCTCAHSGGGSRSFAAGMTAADHDDIERGGHGLIRPR